MLSSLKADLHLFFFHLDYFLFIVCVLNRLVDLGRRTTVKVDLDSNKVGPPWLTEC